MSPPRCISCCTLLRTRKPSVLSAHIQLKTLQNHYDSLFQGRSWMSSGHSLPLLPPRKPHLSLIPTPQTPPHSRALPQQIHSGLPDSENFILWLPTLPNLVIYFVHQGMNMWTVCRHQLITSLFNRLWSFLPVYKSFLGHKIKFHYFDLYSPRLSAALKPDCFPLGLLY